MNKSVVVVLLVLLCYSTQAQNTTGGNTRETYSRLNEIANPIVQKYDTAVDLLSYHKKTQEIIKKAPGREAKFNRLLNYQEQKVPVNDIMDFLKSPLFDEVMVGEEKDFAQVITWNSIALDITALDHTQLPSGSIVDNHPFEQVGPAKTSRALAIVHIAVFEAINAVYRKYESYENIQSSIYKKTGIIPGTGALDANVRYAIAYAAYTTLADLYPEKKGYLAPILIKNLAGIQGSASSINLGREIGIASANQILELRKLDGSEYSVEEASVSTYQTNNRLKWHKDPLNKDPNIALGANWRYVKPFVLNSAEQFRPSAPPAIGSDSFKKAFKEVFELGGDPNAGKIDPPGNSDRRPANTLRTAEQTFIGKFWAYDATSLLCAPPRLYNMIVTSIVLKEKRGEFSGETSALELARLLALVNVGMADAGIAAWEAKYYYLFPRPVTLIRAATPDIAPVENNDQVKFWAPLGAPVSNAKSDKVNFTPPFPSYPSGHATFGGTLFEILRLYWGTDSIKFEFVSDEYNGLNSDPGSSTPRPRTPVTFNSLSSAERQNGESRIYLGIHWKFDSDAGIIQGNSVGGYIFKKLYVKK
jgi:membrane-associated phospholipid phosphatase